jgi:hypothetical protein
MTAMNNLIDRYLIVVCVFPGGRHQLVEEVVELPVPAAACCPVQCGSQ